MKSIHCQSHGAFISAGRTVTCLLAVLTVLAVLLFAASCTEDYTPSTDTEPGTGLVTASLTEPSPPSEAATEPGTEPGTTATPETDTEPETTAETEPPAPEPPAIQNVILLIADGGGYDNFELADITKQALFAKGLSRLDPAARTALTNGRLAPYGYDNGTGLYLNRFLVGSSNTLLTVPHGTNEAKQYVTDSSAAGTALATGHKTTYCYTGIDSDRHPLASLSELAQMNGMATGIVSNKSFADATPLAFFTSHSIYRYEYQDNTLQALLSGIDVVLVEGTPYGDLPKDGASSHLGAAEAGYTVVRNKTEMQAAAARGDTPVWGAFMGRVNGTLTYATADQAADHLSYDIDPTERDEPTLPEMAAAALQMLEGKQDPDGFFLMIEGGSLDNAAEAGKLRYAVGEALAFDETFALCVEWAKQHGDNTLIIATADHDSGGFWGIEPKETDLIDALIAGTFPDGTPITIRHAFKDYKQHLGLDDSAGIFSGHSDMPVPIWLYAPAAARDGVLDALGLPADTTPDKIRHADQSRYYNLEAINRAYLIENTAIAPAIADRISPTTLDEATEALYVPVATYRADGTVTYHNGFSSGAIEFGRPDTRTIGSTTVTYYPVTFTYRGYRFERNSASYEQDGQVLSMEKIGDHQPQALYITTAAGADGGMTGTFYLPRSVVDLLLD